jgi:hypothetical protein
MARKPNPLRLTDLSVDMEVAVYIAGLGRPLYGLVKSWRHTKTGDRVLTEVSRAHKVVNIEVDLEQIVPW